jgi:hypothetical protein
MPVTRRQYEKDQAVLNIQVSITATPTISVTPSVTPTISVTPSVTPTVTPTISVTPSISITPSPTPSSAYFYLANIFTCYSGSGLIECGQFIGQTSIYNPSSNFTVGNFYTGSNNRLYQPISVTASGSGAITVNGGAGYTSCNLACSSSYN